MTHQSMTFWFKPQPKLIHDYSLVGYVLSPHPRIMNDERERMLDSPIYSDAIEHWENCQKTFIKLKNSLVDHPGDDPYQKTPKDLKKN